MAGDAGFSIELWFRRHPLSRLKGGTAITTRLPAVYREPSTKSDLRLSIIIIDKDLFNVLRKKGWTASCNSTTTVVGLNNEVSCFRIESTLISMRIFLRKFFFAFYLFPFLLCLFLPLPCFISFSMRKKTQLLNCTSFAHHFLSPASRDIP